MAKKKFKLDLGKILTLAAMVLALVAFFMMFAPAVEDKLTTTYSGAQVAFGYSKNSTKILVFSAYFIPYLLLIIGLVFSVLAVLGILPKFSKFVSAGCYIAAGVLLFLAVQMATPSVTDKLGDTIKKSLTLSYGAIVSGIFGLLAGIAAAMPVFLKK